MTQPIKTIKGVRATVEYRAVDGGWAWHCRGCGATAGLPVHSKRPNGEVFVPKHRPFIDCEVNGRWDTAEGHCTRAATAHAERVCAGEAARAWKPPAHKEPEE